MKFLMLLRKELRESLPWVLLAAVVLFAIGGLMLRELARYDLVSWRHSQLVAGQPVSPYLLTQDSVLTGSAGLLFAVSIGLGLTLGVRHFWMPHFTRTWPFLLHRSVSRMTVLGSKLAAATIAFIVSLGTVWIALYWYACRPEIFLVPAPVKALIDGWIYIVLGLMVYLATALTGLSRARWYTTKIFGLAFATFIFLGVTMQRTVLWAVLVIAFGMAILLFQVIETFCKREY
ncbi:MAG: hypothetical protein JXN61_11960 [Sedimentisphaerales bacterium]|nr:hypothetical protein [Sedimentisphaerales bacterium]